MSEYRNRSHYSYDSKKNYRRDHYESEYKIPRVQFKDIKKLIQRSFFIKNEKPSAQLTENEVYKNRKQVLKQIHSHQNQNFSQGNTTMDNPHLQQEKMKWEIPIDQKCRLKVHDTVEKQNQRNRTNQKIPCYYSRDYQIPSQPKINLINNETSLTPEVITFNFSDKSLNEDQIKETKIGISNLFTKNTTSILREEKEEQAIKSILKVKKKRHKDNRVFSEEEEVVLKNLILILDLNVTDYNDFLIKVTNFLMQEINTSVQINLKKNIVVAHQIIEKFHKFRLQNYSGKTITMLPKSSLIKTDEISNQNNMNHQPGMTMSQYELNKNSKKKTVPCVFFHSANGCHRGNKCDFIHDENYRGRPTPNMDKYTRPIHQLSKNPEINYNNVQRFQRQNINDNMSNKSGGSKSNRSMPRPPSAPQQQNNMMFQKQQRQFAFEKEKKFKYKQFQF